MESRINDIARETEIVLLKIEIHKLLYKDRYIVRYICLVVAGNRIRDFTAEVRKVVKAHEEESGIRLCVDVVEAR